MTSRWTIGLLLLVAFFAGCSSGGAAEPISPTIMNEAVETPVQGQPTVSAATAGSVESTDSAVTSPTEPALPTATVDIHCTETDPHPIGQSIAETYKTSYEEVMTFFCTGVSFDDIVLAYQTAELAGIDVDEALTLWYDYGNWDDVWLELGIE